MAKSVIAEGKTKVILPVGNNPTFVDLRAKDDITAGDGAKHDVIPDKGRFATQTACNVFRLLRYCGIPVAYERQIDHVTFRAPRCQMLPYEVVVRREAHGSYLECYPGTEKGHRFDELLVQFFLKTSGNKFKAYDLPCDDPLIVFTRDGFGIALYNPKLSLLTQTPFATLLASEVFTQENEADLLSQMTVLARKTFAHLERAWADQGRKLVDFKIEFGLDSAGRLLVADVIDNDSWRLIQDGNYIDKQVYRDGGDLSDVARNYHQVSELTKNFPFSAMD